MDRVADHDDLVDRGVTAVLPAARDRGGDQLGAHVRVAAVAAEREVGGEAGGRELGIGALAHVAGRDAEHDLGPRGEPRQRRDHAVEHVDALALQIGAQQRQIRVHERGVLGLTRGPAAPRQEDLVDDARVGLATEPDAARRVLDAVDLREHRVERPRARAPRVQQGAVDIEQIKDHFLMRGLRPLGAVLCWSRQRTATSSRPSNVSRIAHAFSV